MSLLKQVGVIRSGNDRRELFCVDGKLIAFNIDNSNFDVVGNVGKLKLNNLEVANDVVNNLCEGIDNLDPNIKYSAVIMSNIQLGKIRLYYMTDSKFQIVNPALDKESLFNSVIPMSSEEAENLSTIYDYLHDGTNESLEVTALIQEYKSTYIVE